MAIFWVPKIWISFFRKAGKLTMVFPATQNFEWGNNGSEILCFKILGPGKIPLTLIWSIWKSMLHLSWSTGFLMFKYSVPRLLMLQIFGRNHSTEISTEILAFKIGKNRNTKIRTLPESWKKTGIFFSAYRTCQIIRRCYPSTCLWCIFLCSLEQPALRICVQWILLVSQNSTQRFGPCRSAWNQGKTHWWCCFVHF